MKKLDGFTADIVAERIEELRTVFPEVFKDGKIDFDSLQNILGEHIEDAREKYSFTWAGKLDSIRLAQKRSNGTLRPCKEESVNFDTTQNLYIEGDNLEVLKLLSGSYMNSVKMIYIDPPYNTGNDFVYTDNFSDSIENYKKIIGETAKSNAETAGRYHTNWLNMMLPRLKLARVLLKQDGVIFISIDDNEVTNLRKLCDEVFGEHNFEGHIHWRRRHNQPNDETKMLGLVAEHIVVYAKNSTTLRKSGVGKIDITGSFTNPDNDPRGEWASKPWKVGSDQSGSRYLITTPSGNVLDEEWMGEEKTYKELLADNRIIFPRGGDGMPRKKYFRHEREEEGQCATNWWEHSQFGHNQGANDCITELFGVKNVFSNPKPIELLRGLIQISNAKNNDIILDFFSGSATTAHAVMQFNAERNLNLRFILIQLPENLEKALEAATGKTKAQIQVSVDFLSEISKPLFITEIGKERIRRAGQKIKDEAPMLTESLDTGFKVLKLDTSNLKKWNNEYTRDYEELALRIKGYYDYLTPDRLPLDMVYEIMLKYSLPLTLPVTEVETAGVTAHIITHIGDETTDPYKVLVCMQEDLTIEQMEALSKQGCDTLFFADRCFTDTNAMTNCDEIIKKAGQEMRLF